MPTLPIFKSDDQDLMLLQNRWSSVLNPFLINPVNAPVVIRKVMLAIGTNNVNHLLGKPLAGWSIVRQRAAASIYDTQDTNPTPEVTLTLVSSAACSVDIQVF